MQGPSCHDPDPSDKICCAEVMRWLIRPTSDTESPIPSANMTDFNRISSNLGAAIAYAMTYAYLNGTVSPGSIDCMQHSSGMQKYTEHCWPVCFACTPLWDPCKLRNNLDVIKRLGIADNKQHSWRWATTGQHNPPKVGSRPSGVCDTQCHRCLLRGSCSPYGSHLQWLWCVSPPPHGDVSLPSLRHLSSEPRLYAASCCLDAQLKLFIAAVSLKCSIRSGIPRRASVQQECLCT